MCAEQDVSVSLLVVTKCVLQASCSTLLEVSIRTVNACSLPPQFLLSFHKPIGDWGSPDGVRCKVDTQLYLVCPDHTHKKDHKVIPVNNKNKESCMDTWVDSQVLEFGSLLRGSRVEVPRPGTYSLMTDWTVVLLYLSHLYTEISMR